MSENIPQFSVAEFSKAIKLTIEIAVGYVKINGEITGFKRASSGHLYFNLKEDNAVLTAVCFRNQANAIDFEIGDGLQICASGKITSYEGRSNYQIIVDKIEIAGIGIGSPKPSKNGAPNRPHAQSFYPERLAIPPSPKSTQ